MPNYTNEIYNPLDIWGNPYFTINTKGLYRNNIGDKPSALTEGDYELLCTSYGVNPIYPPKSCAFYTIPAKRISTHEKTADRIAKRRKELGQPY